MKKCGIIILLIHGICNLSNAQEYSGENLEVLRQELRNLKEDTTRVKALTKIADAFGVDQPDSALFYGLKALSLAQKLDYRIGALNSLLTIEVTLKHNGNLVKAYGTAFKGLKLAERQKDAYYRALYLGELGILDGELLNFSTALSLLKRSHQLYDSIREKEMAIFQWNNIGEVYLKQGILDSALYYCRAAYDAYTPVNTWIDYYSSVNLGKIYFQKQAYRQALFYFKQSLPGAVYLSHKFNSNLSIAMAYQFLNQQDSCLLFANKAMDIARESQIFGQLVQVNNFFSSFYEKPDPGRALQFAQTALAYKDSLSRFAEVLVMESFSEFDEQEKQLEIQNAQATYRYESRQLALLGGLGVLFLIASMLFLNNNQKQRANKLLSQQKEEIGTQREKAESALSELKATQSQLIQSEKMASLGAMAAGIAHEIQNPLNFVNNFSELNEELLTELKSELSQGKTNDALKLADDAIENQKKINNHGKRADAIVKGMLLHSRPGSGIKEQIDINVLTEEYLRLAYHGLRAKDKSFTAKIQTNFDGSIGPTKVVPEDMGRVILNLSSNAFYAVNEKMRQNRVGYEPTVSVTTKKIKSRHNDSVGRERIEIMIKDNGNGISQSIKDKIFQPFFTTKPPGQGTGLGLSLSYDIVRAHGGELNLQTMEGDGSVFIITLPSD